VFIADYIDGRIGPMVEYLRQTTGGKYNPLMSAVEAREKPCKPLIGPRDVVICINRFIDEPEDPARVLQVSLHTILLNDEFALGPFLLMASRGPGVDDQELGSFLKEIYEIDPNKWCTLLGGSIGLDRINRPSGKLSAEQVLEKSASMAFHVHRYCDLLETGSANFRRYSVILRDTWTTYCKAGTRGWAQLPRFFGRSAFYSLDRLAKAYSALEETPMTQLRLGMFSELKSDFRPPGDG